MTRYGRQFGARALLLVALAAALLGGVATYGVSALTSTGKTEVRINAQRLDDGRVEFGLQERADDGGWGERILPQRRFLPAEGFVNQWGNSTPIEIDSGLPFYLNTTEPTVSVTVDEYILLCSDDEALYEAAGISLESLAQYLPDMDGGEDEALIWGDYYVLLDLVVTAWKTIAPPPELVDFHAAEVSALNLLAQFAFAQPAEAEVSFLDLFGIGFAASGVGQAAVQNLDPDVRQRLVEGGCLEAEPEPEPEPSGSAESG